MSDELADAGAQAERTALAWQRTGLVAMVVGALLVHARPAQHPLTLWAGVLLMAVGALTAAVLAPVRYVRVRHAVLAGRTPLAAATMFGSAALVIAVAVGIAVTVVLG